MDESMRRVVLVDFPVRHMQRAQEHGEALLREFALIVHGADDAEARIPASLLELAAESERRYSGLNPDAQLIVEAAIARGDEFVDLELEVPATFKDETIEAIPLLLEVEQYCVRGDLLTLVPPADVREFWAWYLGEFIRQVDGGEPISWRDHQPAQA
jgi:hypothetical protein